jgi:hypothetical protein
VKLAVDKKDLHNPLPGRRRIPRKRRLMMRRNPESKDGAEQKEHAG